MVALAGAPAGYDETLFWAHMLQHVLLGMLGPALLSLSGPVTLALLTLPRPGRRHLTRILRSGAVRVVVHPLAGLALFVVPMVALYLTGLYEATLRDEFLHEALHVHFVVAGCAFFWPLIGVDLVPHRPAHAFRLLAVMVTVPVHSLLGVVLLMSWRPIAGDYYRALHRGWGPDPLTDQHLAAGILWVSGDVLGIVVLAAVAVQWAHADDREAARIDRRIAGRSGGGDELTRYNEALARLAEADRASSARGHRPGP